MVFKKSRGGGVQQGSPAMSGEGDGNGVAVRISLSPLRDCSVAFTNSLLPGM